MPHNFQHLWNKECDLLGFFPPQNDKCRQFARIICCKLSFFAFFPTILCEIESGTTFSHHLILVAWTLTFHWSTVVVRTGLGAGCCIWRPFWCYSLQLSHFSCGVWWRPEKNRSGVWHVLMIVLAVSPSCLILLTNLLFSEYHFYVMLTFLK